jgi:hypothetical protein
MILKITHNTGKTTEVWFRDETEGHRPHHWSADPELGIVIRYQEDGQPVKGERWIIPWTSIQDYHVEPQVELVPPSPTPAVQELLQEANNLARYIVENDKTPNEMWANQAIEWAEKARYFLLVKP